MFKKNEIFLLLSFIERDFLLIVTIAKVIFNFFFLQVETFNLQNQKMKKVQLANNRFMIYILVM